MENTFQQQFDKSIETWCNKSLKVLVGVSGGADSMLLLHSLLHAKENIRPEIYVAHVNHNLREESSEEEQFVKDYCERFAIPFFSGQWVDTDRYRNTEKKARDFRYHFFLKITEEKKIDAVLTAHHADDQAETLLMRIGKGTQLQSLSGIPYISERKGLNLIRPLLAFSKKDILDACSNYSLSYVEDVSNASLDYQRNRVRHTVLSPYKEEYPNVVSNFSELTKQVSYANDIIKNHIRELINENLVKTTNGYQLSLFTISSFSDAEIYFFVVEVFQQLFIEKGIEVESNLVYSIMDLIKKKQPNKRLSLPANWIVEKTYTDLLFFNETNSLIESNELYSIDLGEVLQISDSIMFTLNEVNREDMSLTNQNKNCLYVPPSISPPFFIRKVVDGDRFIYNSNDQKKKVSRYFIDEKITREQRKKSWVVLDSSGEIVWLVPFRQSYLCNLKETDRILFELKFFDEDDTIEGSSQSGPRY